MVNPEQVSEIVQHFCGVTACNPEEAHFFLESCNWELDSAIHSFYENTGNSQPSSPLAEAVPASNPVPPAAQPAPAPAPAPSRGQVPMAGKDKKSAKPTARGGIRTLSDLNRPSGSDSDDSDDPQEYYTGGEKSGMLVQDPSKGSNDVDSIFDGARRVGATEVPPDQLRPSSSSRVFTGVGRLLSGETVPSAPRPPEPIVHNITFWRNGFTVGDSPLRRLDDPENGPFLESIKKSECPKELEPADRRVPVHVNLIRRDEDCPVQEQAYTPFQGVGRTLGGSSSSAPAPSIPAPSIPSRSQPESSQPLRGLAVDDSKPSTSIQLRLSDGTRMVARFNYHHTIADIRAFIDAARPGGGSTYQLQAMGFPPKPLNDPMQTIEQAGLINSVVLQKL